MRKNIFFRARYRRYGTVHLSTKKPTPLATLLSIRDNINFLKKIIIVKEGEEYRPMPFRWERPNGEKVKKGRYSLNGKICAKGAKN
jgi:hypothetical protein